MPHSSSVLGSARVIALCTLLSRVLGMVRDVLCSHFFGASLVWDAFAIAYRVPNLFRRLFGEGALTAAFVPAFVKLTTEDKKDEAFALLNRLATSLLLLLGGVTVLGIGATYLLPLFWPDEKVRLVAELLRILLPYLPLVCLGALLGAALNSLFKFFAPAFAPVVLNVTWIAALPVFAAGFPPAAAVKGVAWSIVAGGALQLLVMAWPLKRAGWAARPRWEPSDPGQRGVVSRFLPTVFGLALVQVNELVDSLIAEICVPGHGAVSALYYGNQLVQLPLSLVGTSIATAVLPALSAAAAKDDKPEFSRLFHRSTAGSFFLALPASLGLVLFGPRIISAIFEHGRFGPEETARAGAVLSFYGAGLWCYCVNQVQVRAFHARGDTRTPVKVSTAMVALNLGLNLALVWPLRESGLALATSICGLVNFAVLQGLLRSRYPELRGGALKGEFAKVVAATALMGGGAWSVARWGLPLLPWEPATRLWQRGASLGVILLAALIIYFGAARLLGLRRPAPRRT